MTIPELLERLRSDAFNVDTKWDYGYERMIETHTVVLDDPKYAEELIREFLANPELGASPTKGEHGEQG